MSKTKTFAEFICIKNMYRSLKQSNSKIWKKLKQRCEGQVSILEVKYYHKKTENKTKMGWWDTGKRERFCVVGANVN